MTALGLGMVKEVFKNSHLPVVKLDVEIFEDIVDDESVVTVRVQGVSQRGHKTYVSLADFPNTEKGRKQANTLYLELKAWNGEETK